MNIDDVRAGIRLYRDGCRPVQNLAAIIDFADAVLNPPASVKQAIWNRANYTAEPMLRQADIEIAEWILPFLTPATKETT